MNCHSVKIKPTTWHSDLSLSLTTETARPYIVCTLEYTTSTSRPRRITSQGSPTGLLFFLCWITVGFFFLNACLFGLHSWIIGLLLLSSPGWIDSYMDALRILFYSCKFFTNYESNSHYQHLEDY